MVRAAVAGLLVMFAAPAGLGLLYLVRASDWLAFGAPVHAALPLQQLSGQATQPFGRVAASLGIAGLAAGAGLAMIGRVRPVAGTIAVSLSSLVLLVVGCALADAIVNSGPFGIRVWPALTHAGPWLSAACAGGGAMLALVLVPQATNPNPTPEQPHHTVLARRSWHAPRKRSAAGPFA